MCEVTKVVKAHTRPIKVQQEKIPAQRGELGAKLHPQLGCYCQLTAAVRSFLLSVQCLRSSPCPGKNIPHPRVSVC